METRTLRIWDGKAANASDNCGHASEYKGFYIDDDKNNAEDMGTITWPVRRLGFIFDTKKACIVCFMQYVTSYIDPRPTDLVIEPKKDVMVKLREEGKETKWLDSLVMFKVLAAWSTDPLKADPPRQQVPCQVRSFGKRDMTEKEKLVFANIPRELPALAGRQSYSDEQKTKNWEAKFDEIATRVAEKFSVSLASAITLAISAKSEAAPADPSAKTDSDAACTFRPLQNWREVKLNNETISLRNRENAKDFLRFLWDKGAKCRSKAILVNKKFPKPSSLFKAGERCIPRGSGNSDRDVFVKSELGARICRVYREAVGIVKSPRGTGPHRYYLRAFPDSDKT